MTGNRRRPKQWECVSEEMAEVLRQKTGAERLAIALRMWRFGYQLVSQSVKHQHPSWAEDQIQKEVAKRMSHGAV